MNKITIIVGLPGSGKTHLGNRLSKEMGIPFFDDCATDKNSWDAAVAHIKSGGDCILTDPKFCRPKTMATLTTKIAEVMVGGVMYNYHYFANEPEVCIRNLQDRDERVVSDRFVRELSAEYNPVSYITIPCYRKES